MRILFFLLFIYSCSSIDAEVPMKSLIAPETSGTFLKGSVSAVAYQIHTATIPSETRLQAGDRGLSYTGDGADIGITFDGEIGLLERLDLLFDIEGQLGFKYQLMGEPKVKAKEGNQSLSIAGTYYYAKESDLDNGVFSSSYTADLTLNTSSLYLIYGYRTSDTTLAFVNLRYRDDSFTAKITSGSLNGNEYDYESSQVGLSSGMFVYSENSEIGFEVNYHPFDWSDSEKENEIGVAFRAGYLFL